MAPTEFRHMHPECGTGDVFLANQPYPPKVDYAGTLKTFRLGNIAYDVDGNIVPNMRPMIIHRSELDAFERLKQEEYREMKREWSRKYNKYF